MAFETQINKLKTKYEEIDKLSQNENEEVILFDKLANEEKTDDLSNYYKEDYIIALLAANTNIDFYTIKDAIHNNMELFKKLNYKILRSMFTAVDNALDTIGYDELMDYLLTDKTIEGNFKFKKQLFMVLGITSYCSDVSSFIKIFDLDIINVSNCMKSITDMMELEANLITYNKGLNFSKRIIGNGPVHDRYNKTIRRRYNIDSKIEYLSKMYKTIYEHRHDVEKDFSRKQKKYKKSLIVYNNIIEWLSKNRDSKQIDDIPKELTRIDEDLQLEILREICKLNKKNYRHLRIKYLKLLKSHKTNTILIFKRFGIDINEEEITFDIEKNDLIKILSMLKKMKITDSSLIIKVVNDVPLANIDKIYELYQTNIISTDFVVKNLEHITNEFSTFINNISIARSRGFSNSSIRAIEENLLEDTNKLKRNFDTLEEYNLFDSKKIALCPNILKVEDLDIRIDKVLELGYESLLLDNLNLLDIDPISFKRLIVLRRLNMEIKDSNQLYSILTSNKFVVKDDDLDSYIYTETIHEEKLDDKRKDDFLTMLEDFKNTDRTYNFDGISISINKVKRNVNNIDNDILTNVEQINSIISNSYLDDVEYAKVINCLTAKNKQFNKS